MEKSLFVGLDVGTDSVGWAATDEDFNLLRIKGKTAWGSRIFEEASDAKGRRLIRTMKRRLQRRKARVALLETLFDSEIKKTDPTFLLRLHNSAFYLEDRPLEARTASLIFPTLKEEKRFYKRYPTIWHLRNALIHNEGDAFHDIRLVYLAIHHIIKYRGNFLKEGDFSRDGFEDEVFDSINDFFERINATSDEQDDSDESAPAIYLPAEKREDFRNFVKSKEWNKTVKKKRLMELFSFEKSSPCSPYLELLCTLVSGGEFAAKKLGFENEAMKISLDESFETKGPEIASLLGDRFDIVMIAKTIYDDAQLYNILHGADSLSSAFVRVYETFKEDKKQLKFLLHSLDKKAGLTGENSLYFKVFRSETIKNNFPDFIHKTVSKNRRMDIHSFNKFIQEQINPYVGLMDEGETRVWEELKKKTEDDCLFKTISQYSTSVIPMQLHKEELIRILDNAISRGNVFLREIKTKILQLFEFRIPYYCGPLGQIEGKKGRSNVVFKEGSSKERITPWNFSEKVDLPKTKEGFINSLTNSCSYLFGKPVLPRGSLLMEEYDTYNRVNGIRANSERLPKEDREEVFGFAFGRNKTSIHQIRQYLISHNNRYSKDVMISGLSEVDGLSCPSHAFFAKKPFAWDLSDRNSKQYQAAERIIFLRTIFADCPKDGKEVIHNEFPDLTPAQLKALDNLNPKGWASISRELLTLPYGDETGEVQGYLIDLLREEGRTFNEIFHDNRYGFPARVKEINNEMFGELTPKQRIDDILDSTPPKMRRPVIQALRIVEEIARFSGQDPQRICVEVTRAPDNRKKGKYTNTRRQEIETFYKNLVKGAVEDSNIKNLQEELASVKDDQLRGKHLYLYFLQAGKDLYTGQPISIKDVLTKDGPYDTDHIIPQSMIKDDSIDNLVLVHRELNQRRSNIYPIPGFVCDRSKVMGLWKALRKCGMMSPKKFENLTRNRPLTEDELSGFVAAQINVVNYSNKVLKDVLELRFPDAKVIFSKSMYPSLVRHVLGIPKIRELNDTHHAVDAYLNIVTGVSLTDKFGDMRLIKAIGKAQKENPDAPIQHSLNMEKFVRSLVICEDDGSPTKLGESVLATSQRRDFLMTYRPSYSDGSFYDATVYSPKSKFVNSLVPLHTSEESPYRNTKRYGGYIGASIAFSVIVRIHGKKEKTYVAPVTHMLFSKYGWDRKDELAKEIIRDLGLSNGETAEVDYQHVLYNGTKLIFNGCAVLFTNKDAKQVQLKLVRPVFLSIDSIRYLSAVFNCYEKYPDLFGNAHEIHVPFDRDGNNVLHVNKEALLPILNEIALIANQPCYDGIGMVEKIRTSLEDISSLVEKDLAVLLDKIRYFINVLGRNSDRLANELFRPSRGTLLSEENKVVFVEDSVTGLYSKVEKL